MYIAKSSLKNNLKFIQENSKSGSILLLDLFNFNDANSLSFKIYTGINSFLVGFFCNEPFSNDFPDTTEFYKLLNKYNFFGAYL